MTPSIRPLAHTNGRFFWLMAAIPVTHKGRRFVAPKGSK